MIRIDNHQTICGGEPESAIARAPGGRLHTRTAFKMELAGSKRNASQIACLTIDKILQLFFADSKNAFARSHPKIGAVVPQNAVDAIVIEAVAHADVGNGAILPKQQAGPKRSHPGLMPLRLDVVAIDHVSYIERVGFRLVVPYI